MLILHNGNYVAKGGFWDGKIGFCDVEGADVPAFELTGHSSTVTALAVDKQEKTLISGSKAGEVIVWRNCIYDSVLEAH